MAYRPLHKADPSSNAANSPQLKIRCAQSPHSGLIPSAPAHTVLGKVPLFDEFGQVHLDGGAVCTGLLFGLCCGQLAMGLDQGQQIHRELGQQLGHHFFAFNFFSQSFDLGCQRLKEKHQPGLPVGLVGADGGLCLPQGDVIAALVLFNDAFE